MQPDVARSASIGYGTLKKKKKNPRQNWSKKLENIGNGEKEKGEKAEFPRISGVDSIHGIEDTYVRDALLFSRRAIRKATWKLRKEYIAGEHFDE